MKAWITLILIALFVVPASAQGTLDGDFDADGKVTYDFNGDDDASYDLAVQPDGKILVGGFVNTGTGIDFFAMRLHTDGSFDNSFSGDGRVNTDFGGDDQATTILLQADGKIILAGITNALGGDIQFAMLRYNSDGTLDNSFGSGGTVVTPMTNSGGGSLAYGGFLQPDGKIVLTGYAADSAADANFAMARYNSDGTLDNTFSVDGKVTTNIGTGTNDQGIRGSIQTDGKLLLAGIVQDSDRDFGIVRYNADGTLDNTFGTNGKVQLDLQGDHDEAAHAYARPDGKIWVCGTSRNGGNYAMTVVRLNSDGSMDNSFNVDGKIHTSAGIGSSVAWSLIEQPDGMLLVSGFDSSDFAVVRYYPDGTLDNDFGTNGITLTDFGSSDNSVTSALQPDGRLLAAGFTGSPSRDIAIARYLTGLNIGIEDLSNNHWVKLVYPNPIASSAVFEYELPQAGMVSLELRDMQGRVVNHFVTEKRPAGTNKEVLEFPASLPAGNYLLHLHTGQGDATVQVTVQ